MLSNRGAIFLNPEKCYKSLSVTNIFEYGCYNSTKVPYLLVTKKSSSREYPDKK